MSTPAQFNILPDWRYKAPARPKSVPWELVAPHEKQALANHNQTLLRLHERGGLSPQELWHVLHDKRWHSSNITGADAHTWLQQLVDAIPVTP